jgi:hypothetical protein
MDDLDEDRGNVTFDLAHKTQRRFEGVDGVDRMDDQMGFQRYISPMKRKGWLINVHPVSFVFSRARTARLPFSS